MSRVPFQASSVDHIVRDWIMAHQDVGTHRFFDAVSTIGGVAPLQWTGTLFAIWFWTRGRRRAALAMAVSLVLVPLTYSGVRRVITRDRPPSGIGLREATSSFPSAHSTTAAAVCCTLAYLLWCERILSTPVAIALAIVPPITIGVSRLYLDVHWTTDVVAGWIAGVVIAAVAATAYRRASTQER